MTDPIPLESYYDLSLPSSPAVSPDGERVAFVVRESDPDEDEHRRSVFVAPADGSAEPHRLTRTADAGEPNWSPDGSRLAVTAAREQDVELAVAGEDRGATAADDESTGDEEPRPQVWVFDLERGGDPRQVTDFDEGVREFDWGPDGERIVVSARDPTDEEQEYLQQRRQDDGPIETERLQHKYDGVGWLDTVTTYLFVVDVETRERTKLETAAGRGAFEPAAGLQPAWGPGERIAFVTNRTENPDDSYEMDVHTVAPDGSDRRRITEGRTARALAWSPSGDRLAFISWPPENAYVAVEARVHDVETGQQASVSASLDRRLPRGEQPSWLDDETLVAVIGDGGWTRPVRLPVDAETLRGEGDRAERVFDRLPRGETIQDLDAAGGTVALVRSHPSEGKDVYAMPSSGLDAGADDDDPRVRLSSVNPDLVAEHDLPEATRTTVESEDGQTVEAILYHPAEFDPDDPEPHPMVLAIHGGPMGYDEPGFGFTEAVYTSRGYVVLAVNYRGSSSYGSAFSETLRDNFNALDVADLQAGVDAAVDRGWADPDRLFCTGFSWGGVNTGYLVTRTDRFAAAAAEHGVYDLRSVFGTVDVRNWYEADHGLPWEEPRAYDDASSITDVGGVDTPLLVTAGSEDWRCPPTQSEQLYVAVRKQGIPARLVVYPGENHDVSAPERATHRLAELTEWFRRFDPATDDE